MDAIFNAQPRVMLTFCLLAASPWRESHHFVLDAAAAGKPRDRRNRVKMLPFDYLYNDGAITGGLC